METFFSLNRSAPFLVREGVSENCFGVKKGMQRYATLHRNPEGPVTKEFPPTSPIQIGERKRENTGIWKKGCKKQGYAAFSYCKLGVFCCIIYRGYSLYIIRESG
jgi:hypothetical protein